MCIYYLLQLANCGWLTAAGELRLVSCGWLTGTGLYKNRVCWYGAEIVVKPNIFLYFPPSFICEYNAYCRILDQRKLKIEKMFCTEERNLCGLNQIRWLYQEQVLFGGYLYSPLWSSKCMVICLYLLTATDSW